jgi:integrase
MLKAVEGMGCEPFRVHDFRRTFVTLMAEDEELDANPAVLDAMLNQKVTGVADVYNRVRYLKQSRRYWQYWADQLQKWEGPILKVVAEHG